MEHQIKWMKDANCREMDPEFFFPSDGVGVEQAKAVCMTCPAREACLEHALRNRIDQGVWGGTSERERRRIRAARRRAATAAS
ncbi:MAG: WhiB family transcriptional regulator [Acidimicrobiales bacterium]